MTSPSATLRNEFIAAAIIVAGWILFGTIAYHNLEGWGLIKSFYFSTTSVTTVGYGDLYPTTDLSRLFTAFYVLGGVAIVLTALGVIGTTYMERGKEQLREMDRKRVEVVKLMKKENVEKILKKGKDYLTT